MADKKAKQAGNGGTSEGSQDDTANPQQDPTNPGRETHGPEYGS